MLSSTEQARQKWGGRHNAVDTWLAERKVLLVKYCELAGIPPYGSRGQALPDAEHIQLFCELLMDYLSAGHFDLYDRLANAKTQSSDIYPQISATTEAALAFNDRYADIGVGSDLDGFDRELSKLGEQLEARFELEDQLLHELYHPAE